MKEVYRQFQQELREEGKSIQTIRTYCTDVRLAFETQAIKSRGMKRLEVVRYMECTMCLLSNIEVEETKFS